jgi:PAS domain S-box-containing protein
MLSEWLDEHKDKILDTYVALRKERGDPRPKEKIRRGASLGFVTLIQGLRGEGEGEGGPAGAARQLSSAGIPLKLLAEATYLLYLSIQQVMAAERPASGFEWMSEVGKGLLTISQAATLVLGDDLETQKSEVETLYQISRDLNAAEDKDELLQVLARPAIEAGASGVNLMYVDLDEDDQPEWIEIVAAWERDDAPLTPLGSRYHLPASPAFDLWLSSPEQVQMIANVAQDEWLDEKTRDLLAQTSTQAIAIIPLAPAGRWVGIVNLSWSEAHEFSAQEREIYNAFVGLAAPVVENHRLVDNLEKMVMERTRELHAAETRYLQIVNDALVGIYHNTVDGQVIEANPAFLGFFGVDSVEEINEIGLVNFYMDPSRRQELVQVLQEQEHVTGFEAAYRRKDGSTFHAVLTARLVADEEGQLTRLEGTLEDITQRVQAEAERERLQQDVIQAQQRAIQELSTPVIPVMDRILVMPLVGSIDSARAKHIMRTLLEGIRAHRAKVIILDITGVPIIDSGVATHLDKTIQAARLKGARTIMTGISDAVAEAVVDLGIDWSELVTLSTLQTGLIFALNELGIRLSKM